MKIRTVLTLKYAGVTAFILAALMLVVLQASEQIRSKTFFHDLKSEAITKAHLFLKGLVDAETMHSIYANNKNFIHEVEVAVYTPDFEMLYHDAAQNDIIKEDGNMIAKILREQEIDFFIGKYQGIGILYVLDGKEYVVTAAAYDAYGYENVTALKKTLVILFASSIIALLLIGYFFSWSSLKPIRKMAQEAEAITASDIDKRLPAGGKDEIGELTISFNSLLERLETAFKSQKMFVSNVSHELRTPLASLIAELDLTLQKERTAAQYQQAIGRTLQDAQRMNDLVSGLLNLAKASYEKEHIKMTKIRIDELLMDAGGILQRTHPNYKIHYIFEQEAEDEAAITVMGNSYLLQVAFSNLMDNNCKYSANHTSFVQISFNRQCAIIRLSDNGCGMSEKDKQNLFTLFYRGRQESVTEGYGIGLTLANKIIKLHEGELSVHSSLGQGTTFIVELPHM